MSPQSATLDLIKEHFKRIGLRTRLSIQTIQTIDDEDVALFQGFTRIENSKLNIVSQFVAVTGSHEYSDTDENKVAIKLYIKGLDKLVFYDFGFANLPEHQKQAYREWKKKYMEEALRVFSLIQGLRE
jgi:hypothetical protein